MRLILLWVLGSLRIFEAEWGRNVRLQPQLEHRGLPVFSFLYKTLLRPPGKEWYFRFLVLVLNVGRGIYSVAPIPTPRAREKIVLKNIEHRRYHQTIER